MKTLSATLISFTFFLTVTSFAQSLNGSTSIASSGTINSRSNDGHESTSTLPLQRRSGSAAGVYGSPGSTFMVHLIKSLKETSEKETPHFQGPFLVMWASKEFTLHIPETKEVIFEMIVTPEEIRNGIFIPDNGWIDADDSFVEGAFIP